MNAVERGMYVKRQLEDLIKVRKLRPSYIKSINEEGKKEFLLVDKSNPDGSKPEFILNDLQIEEALSKKLATISDPENNQIMLTELQNRMSDADLQFMNSVWTQILKGIEKTFSTGTNRDLVVDYIVEQVYNLKLNSSKLQKAKVTGDGPTNTIINELDAYIEANKETIRRYEEFVDDIANRDNITVKYHSTETMLPGGVAVVENILHKSNGKNNGKPHATLMKTLDKLFDEKNKADDYIERSIQKYMNDTQTGIAQFKLLLNDEQEEVFTGTIAPFLSSSSSTSGSGLKCKQLLPRSQKKKIR